VELQMTAMIDVVFLLLVFFLWTSSFEKPEYEIASGLAMSGGGTASDASQSPTPVPQPYDDLIITLTPVPTATQLGSSDAAFQIRLNDQTVTPEALRSRLQQIAGLGVQPPVVITPLPGVTMGTAIQIHDIAKLAGLNQILFAISQE